MSKETGSSEFSFYSTTDSSHSLGASHFLLPLPFSMWKMGVILTSFIVWSVRHVPRHTLGKWFSPWLKKSLREAQARVTSNRGQGWVGLSETLHSPALLLQVGSQDQREVGRLFSSCYLLQHILGADQLQKDAIPSASLQLRLLSSSTVSTTTISHLHVRAALRDRCRHTQVLSMPHVNVIWGGHVPAALLAQLHTHCCWWHPVASRSSGYCTASQTDGFPSFQHAAKAQAHNWTQAWGSTCRCWCRWHKVAQGQKGAAFHQLYSLRPSLPTPWLASSVCILGTGLKGLLKHRGCLNIAVLLAQEEWQSESEPFPQLLSTMREGTVLSALSALWRCPPFPIPCQAPHLCYFFSCASTASLYCG